MDAANPFETPTTYRLHRAEYLVFFAISTALGIWHVGQIRWLPAVGLFLYIDLIGYIPGAIAFHRSTTGRISKTYYVLYNTMHSLITQTVVVAAWGFFVRWEWALIAIPFHVFGDRGIFGNFLKPFNLTFEPKPNPIYQRLMEGLAGGEPIESASAHAVSTIPAGVGP